MTAARRTWAALIACLLILVVWNLWVRGATPSSARPFLGLLLAVFLVGVSCFTGLREPELGLEPRMLPAGLRWGAGAFGVVAVVIIGAAVLGIGGSLFDSPRTNVSESSMWFEVLVTIPIGTVIVEELMFRGVLLGLLLRKATTVWAVAICSVLFGLWHIQGVVVHSTQSPSAIAAASLGTFLATTFAGVIFCVLRLKSRSVAAPMLAHLGTNSVALATAWYLAH